MIKDLSKLKIAIVKSNYHPDLTKSMADACKKELIEKGVPENNIIIIAVPGSWEIPFIVKSLAQKKTFDGIVACGIIMKGDTYHFEILAEECARSLMNISLEFNIPIAFEILTTYNLTQAKKRSTGKANKGIEAAKALLETIKIKSGL